MKGVVIFLLLSFANALAASTEQIEKGAATESLAIRSMPEPVGTLASAKDVDEYVNLHKVALGAAENSHLKVQSSIQLSASVRAYRLQQTVQGLNVLSQNALFVVDDKETTPKAIADFSKLADSHFITEEEAIDLVEKFLTSRGQTTRKYVNKEKLKRKLERVYYPVSNRATPAVKFTYIDFDGSLPVPKLVILDANNEIIFEANASRTFEYAVRDFDSVCQDINAILVTEGYRPYSAPPPYPMAAIEIVIDYLVNNNYWSGGRSANSKNSIDFEMLLNQVSDYLKDFYNNKSISNNPYRLNVLVSTDWTNYTPNCQVSNGLNAMYSPEKRLITSPSFIVKNNPEVLVHEISHGIVAESAGLEYINESGALDEAFSDIMGVSFKIWKNNNVSAPARKDWQLTFGNEVMRDFQEPMSISLPQLSLTLPDHYSARYTGNEDEGGVHINSSIINHAFYLMVTGGTHRLSSEPVTKIGLKKAANIWRTGIELMIPRQNFASARSVLSLTAEALYGNKSAEYVSLNQAFDAVGIAGTWVRPKKPPEPTPDPQPKKTDNNQILMIAFLIAGVVILFAVFRMRPNVEAQLDDPDDTHRDNGADAGNRPHSDAENHSGYVIGDFLNNIDSNPVDACLTGHSLIIEGSRIELWKLDFNVPVRIGRSSENQIVLQEPSVSRVHAQIELIENGLTLTDLGSSHGTRCNGVSLNIHVPQAVKAGDKIKFGGAKGEFVKTTGEQSGGDSQETGSRKTVLKNYLELALKGEEVDQVFQHALEEKSLQAQKNISIGRQGMVKTPKRFTKISREHGEFSFTKDGVVFTDKSSNGSFLELRRKDAKVSAPKHIPAGTVVTLYLYDYKLTVSVKRKSHHE